MKTSHISFLTTDGLRLPGLLYEPSQPTKQVAVWLHGMGDSGVFYSPKRITALAGSLTKRGITLLAFNNRGAHNSKSLYREIEDLPESEQRYQAGTYYELIADCVADIDGAVAFLKAENYTEFYLAGHSTGANKICVYDSLAKNNPFSKYVLAGPGDDIGLHYQDLGQRRFDKALTYATQAVKNGQPLKTMPQYTGMHPFSAQAAADILDPDGLYNSFPYYEARQGKLGRKKLFKEYSSITKPMLVIAGSDDEAMASAGSVESALELLKQYASPARQQQNEFQIVPNTDHSFHGAEQDFAERVALWLSK